MENIILSKPRRVGFNSNYNIWEDYFNIVKDPNYNLRQQCKNLYKELFTYSTVGYKKTFTQDEDKNINNMLESNDKYTLELCKQILLTRLNN